MQDIDLNAALNAGAYHPDGTAKNYATYLNKFAVFVGAERYNHEDIKNMVPKKYFNDDCLAKFFYDLGMTNDHKPHFKKAALAAINVGIEYHHLESIYNYKHLYPNLHLIIKQWECYLKVNPYFVHKGECFDTSAVSMILSMTSLNDMELRDLLATVVIVFTGLRANSLYWFES